MPSTAPAAPGRSRMPAADEPEGSTTCGPVSAPTTFSPSLPNQTRSTHPSGTTSWGLVRTRSFSQRHPTTSSRPVGDAYSRYDAAISRG